jgi:Cof subfamily protein (haloacid dehalogenase superfamily)
MIRDAILSIGFDGVISSGGAHIETDGSVIFDGSMAPEIVKPIVAYLQERKCGFSFEKNNSFISNRAYIEHWKALKQRLGESPDAVDDIIASMSEEVLPEDLTEFSYRWINKIVFVGGEGLSFEALAQTFAGKCEIFRGSFPYAGAEGGEIGPLGIHKGFAVKHIAEYHKIPLTDTIAFGDSDNDRRMIETAGIGIAMGNADDALKAIADDVTANLADDGIFKGFKKYGLI